MDLMLVVLSIAILMIFSGAFFKKIQNISITEPFLALLLGIILGPDVFGLIKTGSSETEFKVLKIACEFTIAMALMAAALRIPKHFFSRNSTTVTNLVFFGMLLMWSFSTAIIFLLIPQFSFIECLLLGAIITPTDPVVASTLITSEKAKKYLPARIRNTLSFESGINDGLVFPIVMLSIFLINRKEFPVEEWVGKTLLYENVLCAILAYLVGLGAGYLMKKAHKAGFMSTQTLLPFSLALSLLLLSGFNVAKMNGIIAVFVGGLAFARDITDNEDIKEEQIQESMERITTIPVFFIFGMMLPWNEWLNLGWKAVGLSLLILFFRRIPAFLMLMPILPAFKKKFYDILIMGWFGPIGVAALYYAIDSKEKTHLHEAWIIPALLVFASTVVHGLSSVPLEKLYFLRSGRAKKEKN